MNGRTNKVEVTDLFNVKRQLKYWRNDLIRKSSFGNYDTKNFRKKWRMNAKTYGWEFDDDQDIYAVPKYLPRRYLLITRGKLATW